MFIGSSPTAVSTVQGFEAMCNRDFRYHRSFTSGDLPSTFAASACASDPANDWRSGWSFVCTTEARADSIIAGNYDTRIRNWIQSVPLDHRVDWTFCHEANAKLDTIPLAKQISMFTHVGNLMSTMRSEGVPQVVSGNVSFALCLTNFNFYNQSGATQNRYNDAIAAVDLFTLDIYGEQLAPGHRWTPYSADFLAWWDSTGKNLGTGRVGLWETSANDSTYGEAVKVEWIQQSVQGIYDIGGECFAAFGSTVNGSQNFFSKQIYADTYRDMIDLYGSETTPPPPPPEPPPTPGPGLYVPREGRYYYQSWT